MSVAAAAVGTVEHRYDGIQTSDPELAGATIFSDEFGYYVFGLIPVHSSFVL